MSRHEWRMAAAFVFAVSAAIRLVLIIAPDHAAPLRPDVGGGFDWTQLAFGVLLPLALAEGLRRGLHAFRATPRRDRRRAAQSAEADPATAQRILREIGGGRLSWMTTWSGNQWYLEADRPGYVAYRSHAGVGIALGDPVASDAAARRAMAAAFVDFAQVRGLLPCLFSAGAETAAWARAATGARSRWPMRPSSTCPTCSSRGRRGRTCGRL